jgi:hypothetical protein
MYVPEARKRSVPWEATLGSWKYWPATPGGWAQVVIIGVSIDVVWRLLAEVGVTSPHPSMLDIPALILVVIGLWLLLANRFLQLSGRVRRLEQLLDTDEIDVAELAALLCPPEPTDTGVGPVEAGVRDAIAGYERAGYAPEQARALAREVLRMQVKDSGGWTP